MVKFLANITEGATVVFTTVEVLVLLGVKEEGPKIISAALATCVKAKDIRIKKTILFFFIFLLFNCYLLNYIIKNAILKMAKYLKFS